MQSLETKQHFRLVMMQKKQAKKIKEEWQQITEKLSVGEFTKVKRKLFSEEWPANGKPLLGHHTHSSWNATIGLNDLDAVSVRWWMQNLPCDGLNSQQKVRKISEWLIWSVFCERGVSEITRGDHRVRGRFWVLVSETGETEAAGSAPGRAEQKSQVKDTDGSGDEGGSKRRPVSEQGEETGFK